MGNFSVRPEVSISWSREIITVRFETRGIILVGAIVVHPHIAGDIVEITSPRNSHEYHQEEGANECLHFHLKATLERCFVQLLFNKYP